MHWILSGASEKVETIMNSIRIYLLILVCVCARNELNRISILLCGQYIAKRAAF